MGGLTEARVPDIGGYEKVPVIELLVAVGDTVKADQGLVTLESDKATMEVPAPFAGVIRELKVKLGDGVTEGDVIALIEAADAIAATPKAPADGITPATALVSPAAQAAATSSPASTPAGTTQAESAPTAAVPTSAPPPTSPVARHADGIAALSLPHTPDDPVAVIPGRAPYATPAVRKLARELGVDLARVTGSARGGRIVDEDVKAFVKAELAAPPPTASATPGGGTGLSLLPWPVVDFAKFGVVESQPLTRLKRIAGQNLQRNWATIPHVTQHERADITDMEAFRKAEAARVPGVKMTPLVFLIKAAVAALKRFPYFNASLDPSGEALTVKHYFHIGIAVDTPEGLVVPVIRNADQKGLVALAEELAKLSAKARDKKLTPADMAGGCFSISSLGGIGGTAFTPIVNAPEVAILGVSKAAMTPVWDGEGFAPRLMLPLSLSYDHRVIDGADAARFTAYLAEVLGDVRRLLL